MPLVNHFYWEQCGAEWALCTAAQLTQSLPNLPFPWQHPKMSYVQAEQLPPAPGNWNREGHLPSLLLPERKKQTLVARGGWAQVTGGGKESRKPSWGAEGREKLDVREGGHGEASWPPQRPAQGSQTLDLPSNSSVVSSSPALYPAPVCSNCPSHLGSVWAKSL